MWTRALFHARNSPVSGPCLRAHSHRNCSSRVPDEFSSFLHSSIHDGKGTTTSTTSSTTTAAASKPPSPSELVHAMRRWVLTTEGDARSRAASASQRSRRGGRRSRRGHDHATTKAPRRELPPSFGPGCHKVVNGERPVLAEASEFSFGCTGCGACCRALPNSVLLDPHDVFRMSRAVAHTHHNPLPPTAALQQQHPTAFAPRLGLFQPSALPVDAVLPTLPTGVACAESGGVVPVLFLRSATVAASPPADTASGSEGGTGPQSTQATATATASATARGRRRRRQRQSARQRRSGSAGSHSAAPSTPSTSAVCHFAVPTGPTDHPTQTLACSLGRDHMPTSCALYPLGELWACSVVGDDASGDSSSGGGSGSGSGARAGPGSGGSSGDVALFFTVDDVLCEGVGVADVRARSVAQYRADNALAERRESWLWFQKLATTVAVDPGMQALFDRANERSDAPEVGVLHTVWDVLRRVWYDYDALFAFKSPGDPPLESWHDVRRFIDEETTATLEFVRHVEPLRRGDDMVAAAAQFRQDSGM